MPRSLLASWLTTFVVSAAATLALSSSVPACQTACIDGFDCSPGEYCQDSVCLSHCVVDRDCPQRECPDPEDPDCRSTGARCDASGRCDYYHLLGRTAPEGPIDGIDDPVGVGQAFVVDSLRVAPQGMGFDVDDRCGPGGCIDNALAPLGPLGNQQIDQGVRGGESLLLLELSGLQSPFTGNERTLTVKFYPGLDADVPAVPSDNFSVPPGSTTCCRFHAKEGSVDASNRATSRVPARISGGQLTTLLPADLRFTLPIGDRPFPELLVQRAHISGQIPIGLQRIERGLLGGATPAHSLARIGNPYCKTDSMLCARTLETSTMLDLVTSFFQPDIDLDDPRDGLDRLTAGATGIVDQCADARGTPIAPVDPLRPSSCGESPELRDGFSVAFEFTAVPATIVGIR